MKRADTTWVVRCKGDRFSRLTLGEDLGGKGERQEDRCSGPCYSIQTAEGEKGSANQMNVK